ncbi:response regulator [Hirschia litorea]|uniref:Response regulator n=1 Tax=Hirschia litorea TaxID=1199156 RepID=A0ABW2IK46_9PROT
MSKRILLVEDERVDQVFIVRAINKIADDIEIEIAKNGEEALAAIKKNGAPCLIVTDLNMPIMDGHALLDALAADEALQNIPTIVLSTSDARHQVKLSYEKRANAYMVKPSSPSAYSRIAESLYDFWFKVARLPAC